MVSHWSLSKQVSSSLQDSSQYSTDLNNAVVRMVSSCPPSFPIPLSILQGLFRVYQLQLVSSSPSCSIAFLVLWQGLGTYLSFFTLLSSGTLKFIIQQFLFIFFVVVVDFWLLQGLVAWPRLGDPFVSQNPRDGSPVVHIPLFLWSSFNFLYKSQWITFPTRSCLVLYSFCANLLYSLIMWLIVSSLSPQNLHLQFVCIFLL